MTIIADDIFRIYFWLVVFGAMFGTLAQLRRMRKIAGAGFIYSSYLLGFLLWIGCAGLVYRTWGLIALLVSILVFGIGPFFSATIICMIHAEWLTALALITLFVLLIAARFVGHSLSTVSIPVDETSIQMKPHGISRWLRRKAWRRPPTPEVAAAFERLAAFLKSEEEQNARLPAELRSRIAANPSCDTVPNGEGQFGKCLTNPIPANGPLGQAVYLSSLRINGAPVLFHRLGSHSGIDVFETVSLDGAVWDTMFISLYFPRRSRKAPSGYQVAPDEPSWTRIFGTTARVDPFPHSLCEAVKAFNRRMSGIPIANREIEMAIASTTYVASAMHRQRVDELVRSRMQLALTDGQAE